jgi:AraC-like DNA-binding protein/mannose-6-phosphate isomerase-like protein (cupin superfamily)
MLTYLDFDASPRRVPSDEEPVTVHVRHPALNLQVPAHRHPWAQIAYPFRGSIQVEASGVMWVVPPLRAVWIPPGVEHQVTMLGAVELRTIYIEAKAAPRAIDACTVFEVSDLLRALFEALLKAPAGDLDSVETTRQRLLTDLLLTEVRRAPALLLGLPMPRDRRLQALCQALIADPASSRTLDEWAVLVGASARTLARLFRDETNLGFGAWRQQLRLERSIELISCGVPLGEVAQRMGYASQSAFSAMFKRSFGQSPSHFIGAGAKALSA